MARQSNLLSLPAEQRRRVDSIIRQHNYYQLDDMVELLAGEGFQVSRSALHRHVTRLRQQDERLVVNDDERIVVVMDRATGEIITVKTSAAASDIAAAVRALPI